MIKIVMDDGERLFWDADEYTDYEANYGLFIVKNGDRWIGIYNIDHLLFVEVDDDSKIFNGFNVNETQNEAVELMQEAQERLKKNMEKLRETLAKYGNDERV